MSVVRAVFDFRWLIPALLQLADPRSEEQFGAELDLSTRDTRAADHAELRRVRGQARIAERSVIQRVEELRSELHRGGLTPSDRNLRVLHERQIEVVYAGSTYDAVSRAPEDAEKVVGEATGIEPPVKRPRTVTDVAVANAVGAVQVLPADIRRYARTWRQRKSAVRRVGSLKGPAASHGSPYSG